MQGTNSSQKVKLKFTLILTFRLNALDLFLINIITILT